MKKILLSISIVLCYKMVSAQRLPISVNLPTGTANVVVPITTVTNGSVSVPISLVYGSNGIKLKDGSGNAGLGWNLVAGGQVSRKLRGLPDDVQKGMQGQARIGWYYAATANKIYNFGIVNNPNPPNCVYQTADLNYINSNFSNIVDTEPDIFSINAPGLSCEFVFDGTDSIRTISYQDLKIIPSFDTDGTIASFTVVNDKGTTYVFSLPNVATIQTTTQKYPRGPSYPLSGIKYYLTQFDQFAGGVSFYDSWKLYSITDANGNTVEFEWPSIGETNDRTAIGFKAGTAALDTMYFLTETHNVRVPGAIHGLITGASLSYGIENNNVREGALLKSVEYLGVKYNFNYDAITIKKDSASFNGSCLRNITTDQCDSPLNIYFDYEGESNSVGTYQYTNRDSAYMFTDIWGYYTGKRASTFGAVQPTMVNAGMLKQIKYYDSGTTTFEYESNNYYDPTVTSVVNGGGVRIKTITDYDGISTANNIVKNYTYLDPSTGSTSGIPISLPQVSFLRPVASSPTTTNSTVAATMDLSEEDHTIMYTHVKESQTGKGYIQYEYKVPAGAFDTSVPLGDWAPTIAHAADSACVSMGLLINQANSYPFAPNTNYDFERGLLNSQISYNDSGNKVAESTYTHQRTNSPIIINAFRFDKNDYSKSYSKYNVYANVSELTTVIKNKVYDLGSTTTYQTDSTRFVYGVAAKNQVIQQEQTGSDGSVTRTNISYSKEYTGSKASTYSAALVTKISISL